MRVHLPFLLIALISASPAAAQNAAQDMPARKTGLWEVRMTMEAPGMPPQVMQQCIDPATDKTMNSLSGGMGEDKCSQQSVKRSGNTITIDSVCQTGAGTSATTAVITGDFDSAYTIKMTSRQQSGGTIGMTLAAKYLGACKTGQRPGDVIMANGIRMNIRDMQRGPAGAAPGAPRMPQR